MGDPKYTEWLSGGLPYSVTTEQRPNEDEVAWCRRHDEAVEFWQGVYPPDP